MNILILKSEDLFLLLWLFHTIILMSAGLKKSRSGKKQNKTYKKTPKNQTTNQNKKTLTKQPKHFLFLWEI